MTLLVVAWCDLLRGSVEIGGEEAGVSVDVGGGNLEEKLAPSSEKNLIITLEGGELAG